MPETEPLTSDLSESFDEEYFRTGLGPRPYERANSELLQFFARLADELIRALQPRTVLDAGCAMGFLVEAFWDRGVSAQGVDVSRYAISQVRRDMQAHCRVASLEEPINGRFDLVACIEVLEHMPWQSAKKAIENLTRVTDTILFSSSPDDLVEPTHVNVNQPIVWLEEFSRFGFYPDLLFDASFVAPQTLLLRRTDQPLEWSVLRLFAELVRRKVEISKLGGALLQTTQQLQSVAGENQQLSGNISSLAEESRQVFAVLNQLAGFVANISSSGQPEGQNDPAAFTIPQKMAAPLQTFLAEIVRCLNVGIERSAAWQAHEAQVQQWAEAVQRIQAEVDELKALKKEASSLAIASGELAADPIAQLQAQMMDMAEQLQGEISVLRHQIALLVARSDTNASPRLSASVDELRQELESNRQAVGQLGNITVDLHNQIEQMAVQVHDILHGRIWRTLSGGGRFVLKMFGRS